MKTLRYRIGSEVKPGILDADKNIRDASDLVTDWDSENITVEKLNEIKSKIDSIDTFPNEAEKPVIQLVTLLTNVLQIFVYV